MFWFVTLSEAFISDFSASFMSWVVCSDSELLSTFGHSKQPYSPIRHTDRQWTEAGVCSDH